MDSGVRQRRTPAQAGPRPHQHHHHHRHEQHQDGHISCLSWMFLVAVFYLSITSFNILVYSHLPTPKKLANSKPNEFTEEGARVHLKNFLNFGSRPSGSFENDVDSVNYILRTIADINASAKSKNKKVEVDTQYPTGSFYLPHHDHFMSYYSNVSNTVVRITSPQSDNNALLLNCHTDSVANAPGASDDAIACSVLLEIFRAIMADEKPLLHPLIFLFNGAEENVLQASHGFITQHKWVDQIKAFINLEAAGAGGKEILFQHGPENPWLISAWANHAPHPHGSSLAQDLFHSGIIPSDTDFRIFRDHGDKPGIDLAYIKNGYVYHTLHDTEAMIQPGCAQRAGENIYGVVRHMVLSTDSLLPDPSEYRHGSVAYFDLFSMTMVVMPLRLVVIVNYLTIVAVLFYIGRRMLHPEISGYTSLEYSTKLIKAVAVNILGYAACFLCLLLTAAFLTKMNRSMSWYSNPPLAAGLYLPSGLLGLVTVHCVAKKFLFKNEDSRKLENLFFDGAIVMWTSLIFQTRNMGASHFFTIPTLLIIIGRGYLGRDVFLNRSSAPGINRVVLYLGVTLLPTAFYFDKMLLLSDFILTLTGRSGSEIPPEVIISSFIGLLILIHFSFQVCTVYLVNSMKTFYVIMVACLVCSLATSFSPSGFPFDSDPISPANKRFYVSHTKREFYGMDGALEKTDSGFSIYHIDYTMKQTDVGPPEVMETPIMDCAALDIPYCDMPFPMPVVRLVNKVQYIPTTPPSSAATTDIHPFDVKVKKSSKLGKNGVRDVQLDISIQGPPFMTIQFTVIQEGSLIEWSMEGKPKGRHSRHTGRETYYILYGAGFYHPTLKFWLRFQVTGPETDQLLDLCVGGHYKSSGPVSRINKQTPELENFTSRLHDWVAPMTWPTLYKKLKI